MSEKDLVSEEVLQELTNKIQEIVNNYCWNLEYFSDSEVDDFFQASADEVTFYNGLINDKIESQNFLWSSKHVAEKIAQSILEANEYTNSLLKNISSIQLEWCETNLPTTGENNKIYILPVTSESTTVNTLNIWNSTTCEFISIGNLEIDLTNYYTKTETDEKLDLKANADEVISNDKIVQTLDSTTNSSDTILSTSGLQVELDKKVDKGNIVTTIDSTSTNNEVVGAKTIYEKTKNMCTTTVTDVPKTLITSEDTTVTVNQNSVYTVINGICYVQMWGFKVDTVGQRVINSSLPKPKTISQGVCSYGLEGRVGGCIFIHPYDNKGKLYADINVTGQTLYATFSYPVA